MCLCPWNSDRKSVLTSCRVQDIVTLQCVCVHYTLIERVCWRHVESRILTLCNVSVSRILWSKESADLMYSPGYCHSAMCLCPGYSDRKSLLTSCRVQDIVNLQCVCVQDTLIERVCWVIFGQKVSSTCSVTDQLLVIWYRLINTSYVIPVNKYQLINAS